MIHLSEKVFLHHFREWMNKELTVGNYYVKSVQSFSDIQEQHEFSEGITKQYRLNLALGILLFSEPLPGSSRNFLDADPFTP